MFSHTLPTTLLNTVSSDPNALETNISKAAKIGQRSDPWLSEFKNRRESDCLGEQGNPGDNGNVLSLLWQLHDCFF